MAFNNRIYLIILALVGQLFFFGYAAVEPLEASDHALGQERSLPASVPEKNHLTLVSRFPLVVEGEVVGEMAEYDDTTTGHSAYREFYDNTGDLLAVSWFDRFGIERTAIDRGLLEERNELEGVFIVFLEGESV